MNRKSNNVNRQPVWELQHSPQPSQPTLESITRVIVCRQKKRSIKAAALIVATIASVVAIGAWRSRHLSNSPVHNLATRSNDPAIFAAHSSPSGTVASVSESVATQTTSIDQTIETNAAPTGFKLYANLRSEAPVFQFDDQRGVMVPIGWVRSTDQVPVDLGPLSQDELKTFETILRDEPPQYFF